MPYMTRYYAGLIPAFICIGIGLVQQAPISAVIGWGLIGFAAGIAVEFIIDLFME